MNVRAEGWDSDFDIVARSGHPEAETLENGLDLNVSNIQTYQTLDLGQREIDDQIFELALRRTQPS